MAATSSPTPAQRLAALLESASPEDRREITAWLLGSARPAGHPHHPGPAVELPWLPPPLSDPPEHPRPGGGSGPDVGRLAGILPTGVESQMVTLRLPADRHAALRDWCVAHGFSMAAVVRGLVERFLEGQPA